jgi:hypothetical protein
MVEGDRKTLSRKKGRALLLAALRASFVVVHRQANIWL